MPKEGLGVTAGAANNAVVALITAQIDPTTRPTRIGDMLAAMTSDPTAH